MGKVETLCSNFPLYSDDLGIELTKPSGRFRWFLASILFGARSLALFKIIGLATLLKFVR